MTVLDRYAGGDMVAALPFLLIHLSPDAQFIINGGRPRPDKRCFGHVREESRKAKQILPQWQGYLRCGEGCGVIELPAAQCISKIAEREAK
jgi:hypothetical protein